MQTNFFFDKTRQKEIFELAEKRQNRYSGKYGYYGNTKGRHIVGLFGEFAWHAFLSQFKDSIVEPNFLYPEKERLCDIVFRNKNCTLNMEIKAWASGAWHLHGGSIAQRQFRNICSKANVLGYAVVLGEYSRPRIQASLEVNILGVIPVECYKYARQETQIINGVKVEELLMPADKLLSVTKYFLEN